MIKVDVGVCLLHSAKFSVVFNESKVCVGTAQSEDDIYDIVEKWSGRVHGWFMPDVPLKIETKISPYGTGKMIEIDGSFSKNRKVSLMALVTEVSE